MTKNDLIIIGVSVVAFVGIAVAVFLARNEDRNKQGKKYRKGPDGMRHVLDPGVLCVTCKGAMYRPIERRRDEKFQRHFDGQVEQTFYCFTCRVVVTQAYPEGLGDTFARTVRVRSFPG